MWHYEHGVEATPTPEHIWRYWSDIAAWPQWNDGIEKIEIDGPFAVGTMFTMTRRGGPRCAAIGGDRAGQLFTDEMDAGDFVVRTVHRLEPTATGRTRITHQTEITGLAAGQVGPQFGPAITADFPEVLAALVWLAERQALPLGPDGGPAVPLGMPRGAGPINLTQVPDHAGCRPEMAHVLAIEVALTPGPPSSDGQQEGDGADRYEMVAAQEGVWLRGCSALAGRACRLN